MAFDSHKIQNTLFLVRNTPVSDRNRKLCLYLKLICDRKTKITLPACFSQSETINAIRNLNKLMSILRSVINKNKNAVENIP